MKKMIALIFCMTILLGTATGCRADYAPSPAQGLFSWKSAAVEDPRPLLRTAEKAHITELYQAFSDKLSQMEIDAFLEQTADAKLDVYWLAGEPDWGLDPKGEELLEEVEKAAAFRDKGLHGVVFDVEPYLTDAWDEDPGGTMDLCVSALERAYQAAKEQELRCVVCIPYFYDDKGLGSQLEELIAQCCDVVAVMNYQKKDEAGQIAFEAELAQKHGKAIIQIYELQEPGKHDLTDRNTYYHDGLDAVGESQAELSERFPGISFAYHEVQALKELLKDE